MSAEGDQVNGVSAEETEKPKEVAKAAEAKDEPPQQNGEIGENENTEANANESQKDNKEEEVKKDDDHEQAKSEDAPTQPEKFVETEVKEESKEEEPAKVEAESEPAKAEDAASPAPPQIIVDTVPDRDPESPTEPEASKPTEESKTETESAATEEEQKAKEESTEKKTEDSSAAAAATGGEVASEDKPKEEEQKEQKEKDESGAASAGDTAEKKEESGDKVEQTETVEDGAAAGPTPTPGKPNFNGKYKQVSVECENIDAFFQALGLPWLLRKLAGKMAPTTEVRQDGEKFHLKLTTGFLTKDVKFTVGEDFEDAGMGWKKEPHLVSPNWDGDKLVLMATPKNEKTKAKPMKQTREMDGEKMSILFEIGDQKCKRIFEKKK